jgi:hypothetical protein
MPEETNFEGHTPRVCGEHRTVGSHRAWCFDDGSWCYPDDPCAGCDPKNNDGIDSLPAEQQAFLEHCAQISHPELWMQNANAIVIHHRDIAMTRMRMLDDAGLLHQRYVPVYAEAMNSDVVEMVYQYPNYTEDDVQHAVEEQDDGA